MAKQDKPQVLYKVEFWEENKEHEPVYVAYIMARTPKGAINTLKWRGFAQARQQDKVWLSHLFYRDDITIDAFPDPQWAAKQKLRGDLAGSDSCKNCGGKLDDDYCQECGWRRGSWLDRARKDGAG